VKKEDSCLQSVYGKCICSLGMLLRSDVLYQVHNRSSDLRLSLNGRQWEREQFSLHKCRFATAYSPRTKLLDRKTWSSDLLQP
jgi:hypothetical protein